jgi:hypothetical protein
MTDQSTQSPKPMPEQITYANLLFIGHGPASADVDYLFSLYHRNHSTALSISR